MRQSSAPKLHALTTLRFFAAAMIVFHHSGDLFGFPHEVGGRFVLSLAVSFFFALSGFILTYVYPVLDTWEQRGRFLLARFARIWPAHIAAFGLLWLLLQTPANFPTQNASTGLAVLNLVLVHGWVPIRNVFFSFNPVSWTISTEFFFYLVFPFMIWRWRKTWWMKLLLALSLAVAAIIFCKVEHLPLDSSSPWSVTATGILYINPVARLFEFTVGMCAALLFQRTPSTISLGRIAGTLLELAAIALVILNMYYAGAIANLFQHLFPGTPVDLWISVGPVCCLSFTLLIYIMALHRGWISQLLSTPPGILLGEISYSVYLIHYVLITFYRQHATAFINWPNKVAYAFFWAILLVLSWLVWAAIERPLRTWIVSRWPKPATDKVPTDAPPRRLSILTPGPIAFVVALLVLGILILPIHRALAHRAGAEIKYLHNTGIPEIQETRFDTNLMLLAAKLSPKVDGLDLALAWQTVGTIPPDTLVGVHLVDDSGKILSQRDYPLHPTVTTLPADGGISDEDPFWVDHVTLPTAQLPGATHVAISIYHPGGNAEAVDRGPRDWDNHRLLLLLPH